MSKLGETAARLARMRAALSTPSNKADDAGLREVRGFGFNPGALRMLAYVPDKLPKRAPLVVALHGCTQRAGAYAHGAGWTALADRLGFAVLAPEQTAENNPNRCFNWFEPGDIARGVGEAASIHAMVEHLVRTHGLDRDRVFVTGLSAGGAMASVLLATYPETFAAGAVIAGLPFGVAGNVQQAFAAMRGSGRPDHEDLAARVRSAAPQPKRPPKLAIWHGQADGTVAVSNAAALAGQWAALHGLPEAAQEVLSRPGWTRSVWRDAQGEPLIEMNLVAGLGHGTPLAAAGDDPLGEVAPFMLEAGISSSLEIARFWGLAPADTAAEWKPAGVSIEPPDSRSTALGESVLAQVAPHVPDGVQQVIAKALKSAGLMD